MQVYNDNTYLNSIYAAIVVNADTTQDPEGKNRVQVYIPSIQSDIESQFNTYFEDPNKTESEYKDLFPWAVSLVGNLAIGCIVYVNTVENISGSYVILGADMYDPNNIALMGVGTSGAMGSYSSIGASGMVELIMPIMLENEVGIPHNRYPDNIPENIGGHDTFGFVDPDDNGGWSIGIIQWHNCLAYDLMYEVAKADTSWKNKFLFAGAAGCDLYRCLEEDVTTNGRNTHRNDFEGYKPWQSNPAYRAIKECINSDLGRQTQLTYARSNIQTDYVDKLVNDFKVTSPSLLIMCSDIMNQYGTGINNSSRSPNLRGCMNKAYSIQNSTGDLYQQAEQYYNYWSSCTSNYLPRRKRTLEYIKELYTAGKLTDNSLTSVTPTGGNGIIGFIGNALSNLVNGNKFFWPVTELTTITSKFGPRSAPTAGASTYHKGIDISGGNAMGKEIIASSSGKIAYAGWASGYGNVIYLDHPNNYQTRYAHQCRFAPGISVGVEVKAGQVIGYVGNTGIGTGPHLHFEIRKDGEAIDPQPIVEGQIYNGTSIFTQTVNTIKNTGIELVRKIIGG